MAEETFIMLGLFALLAWLFWLFSAHRQREQRFRVEFRAQVLSRFENAGELQAFLDSQAGREFLRGGRSRIPLSRIMIAAQLGLFLTLIGFGLIGVALLLSESNISIPGVIFICGGVGFMISALFSYRFSEKHGLLEPREKRNNQEIEP